MAFCSQFYLIIYIFILIDKIKTRIEITNIYIKMHFFLKFIYDEMQSSG